MSKISIKEKNGVINIKNKIGRGEVVNEGIVAGIAQGYVPGLASVVADGKELTCQFYSERSETLAAHLSGAVSKEKFLHAVGGVFAIVKACEASGLSAGNLCLEADKIFYDKFTGEFSCIYWPVDGYDSVASVGDFFKNLAFTINFDSNEDTAYASKYVQYFNTTAFTNATFEALLVSLADMSAAPAPAAEGVACSACGKMNNASDKFCQYCGTPMAAPAPVVEESAAEGVACSACGKMNNAGDKFCQYCGAPMSAPAPVVEESAAEGVACSACGKMNNASDKFCQYCGTPMSAPDPVVEESAAEGVACSACGKMNNASDKFCQYCGTPMSAPAPVVEESAVEEPVVEETAIEEEATVFCSGCGQKNPVTNKFCQYCGTPVVLPEPVAEEPVIEEPVIEEPVVEEPVVEEPVAEEPVIEEPVIEEPVAEEPVAEEPAVEEVSDEAPIGMEPCRNCGNYNYKIAKFCQFCGILLVAPEMPVVEVPVAEEPVVEEPVAEEPVVEEPVVEEPVVEEPVVEEPVVEEPVVEEPVVEEPVVEEPVVEEPVVEEPVAEEPVVEEPVVEEPVVEEPVVEEPVAEEPVVEEPVVEEPVVEEPVVEEPVVEEPVVEAPSYAVTPPAYSSPDYVAPAYVPPVYTAPEPAPAPAPNPYESAGIGETTVLGYGETTVLSPDMFSTVAYPYLIREKYNENIVVNNSPFKIGKDPTTCNYCVFDNNAVSRSHAHLLNRGNRYFVVDLGSTNRTFVDGRPIPSNTEVEIYNGTKLRFANEDFVFYIN